MEAKQLPKTYPNFTTLMRAVPYTDRPLPPKLVRSFATMSSPMATTTIDVERHRMAVDEARQSMAEDAIRNNVKYLFFWDEDVLLLPHTLCELIYFLEHYPKFAVVGGIYCIKRPRPEPMVFKGRGCGPYWDWKAGEVFEVDGISMGATLIRVDCFKDLPKPWFKTVQDNTPQLDGVPMQEYWSEDLYFCNLLRTNTKWRIAAHGGLLLPHVDVKTGEEYVLPPDSKPLRDFYVPPGKKRILDLGSGVFPYKTREGKVVTVDFREEVEPDYRCDVRRLPFGAGEFDIVRASHLLEHLPPRENATTIKEWMRVMAPKGELRISVPNIEESCRAVLAGKGDEIVEGTDVTALQLIYGDHKYEGNDHLQGFTREALERLMTETGLECSIRELPWEFQVTARRKPKAKKAKSNGHGV